MIVSFRNDESEALAGGHRVCFRWTSVGAEDVEIVDYH
jgi:plasmid maintenance system killer protein